MTAGPDAEQQKDLDFLLTVGQIFSLIAYGRLILEQAELTGLDDDAVAQIFDTIIRDFSSFAVDLLGEADGDQPQQDWARDAIAAPTPDPARFDRMWSRVQAYNGAYEMNPKDSKAHSAMGADPLGDEQGPLGDGADPLGDETGPTRRWADPLGDETGPTRRWCPYPARMNDDFDDDGGDYTVEQLQPEDMLADEELGDVLDRGYSPPDRPPHDYDRTTSRTSRSTSARREVPDIAYDRTPTTMRTTRRPTRSADRAPGDSWAPTRASCPTTTSRCWAPMSASTVQAPRPRKPPST